jgi:glucose/arabinose dehydrogenase
MAFLGPNDFLVLEKTGSVRRVKDGVLQPGTVLGVIVNASGEMGLLGIAINTETPRKVFLFYTEALVPDGTPLGNRVYRYTWNATTQQLESPLLVLDLPAPGSNHNGGTLALGPPGQAPGVGDGALLYAVIGDVGRSGKLENIAAGAPPDDTAVILRVRQDGTPAPGNPFTPYCRAATAQTCDEDADCGANGPCELVVARYFAYGVRNSFGMALDPLTGRLWNTENGPNTFDEVNRVAPGTNSGWNPIMGPDALDPQGLGDLFDMPGAGSTYSDPEFSWQMTIAPTAIVLPYGSVLGSGYDDAALVADFNFGQLYALPLDAMRNGFDFTGLPDLADLVANHSGERDQVRIGSGFAGGISDLKIGPDAALYLLTLGGSVYRISGPGVGAVVAPGAPLPDLRELGRRLGAAAASALGLDPP